MIGKKTLFATLDKVMALSPADETEIVFIGTESGLTRYANSAIHQNVHENNCKILFRTILGKRIGVASTNSLVFNDLQKTLQDSVEIARTQLENPYFPGLPKPLAVKPIKTFDLTTAEFSPRERAQVVKKIIMVANRKKFTVAGAFSTNSGEIAIMNSKGVRAYQPVSSASVNIIAMSGSSSGYAAGLSRKVGKIDFEELAAVAVGKCAMTQNPKSVEPGEYEVILEPAAVASLLEWMNYIGFGSKSYQEKTSFLAGKIGQKITSPMITIYDDALDSTSVPFPFDFEGVPKKKVKLIEKGTAKGVVYDRLGGAKDKTCSTGHALTADSANEGAIAMNIVMVPGKTPRNKLIAGVKRGILVTRFHYINGFIDPPNAVLTGMTRDGTFLIENGEISGGIKNLRFTDSMLRAFGTAVAISKESTLVESWWSSVGCVKAPAIHLGSFRFSGKTEF